MEVSVCYHINSRPIPLVRRFAPGSQACCHHPVISAYIISLLQLLLLKIFPSDIVELFTFPFRLLLRASLDLIVFHTAILAKISSIILFPLSSMIVSHSGCLHDVAFSMGSLSTRLSDKGRIPCTEPCRESIYGNHSCIRNSIF